MVVIFFIVLIVGFIDDNSFMHRFDRRNSCLREMDSDPKTIEKLARERYYMKRPGEDVFVIRDSEEEASDVTPSDSSVRY